MLLDNTWIVTSQVLILFIMIGAGYVAAKTRMINEQGIRQMTNVLLTIIMPSLIIQSFQTPFNTDLLRGLLIAFFSAIGTHLIGALIAKAVFRNKPVKRRKILEYAVVFSNCGFMSIPLLYAILGSQGVLYGSMYITVFNVGQWTYGVHLMSGDKGAINLKPALINPGTVSILLAFPLFLLGITLPAIPTAVVTHLAAINSPLAMMLIGAQLSLIKLGSVFTDRDIMLASLMRLFLIPLIMMLILHLLPYEMDRILFLSCLIPAAAPTAAAVALFATRHDQDALLATRTIALSTLLSIISIPLLILITDLLRA